MRHRLDVCVLRVYGAADANRLQGTRAGVLRANGTRHADGARVCYGSTGTADACVTVRADGTRHADGAR
eukprot:2540697-Prymnesium_polylepis.1